MQRFTRQFSIVAFVFLLACTWGTAQAKLYRWVDEEGNVHYSDRIPADASQQQRKVLDEQGRTLEERDPKAELRESEEEKAEKAREEAERKAREEKTRQDRVLLQTFTSVDEIKMLRDDRAQALESALGITREKLERLRATRDNQMARIKRLEEQGKPVPDDLAKQLSDTQASITDNESYIERREADKRALIEKFNADIERFKELKAAQ